MLFREAGISEIVQKICAEICISDQPMQHNGKNNADISNSFSLCAIPLQQCKQILNH